MDRHRHVDSAGCSGSAGGSSSRSGAAQSQSLAEAQWSQLDSDLKLGGEHQQVLENSQVPTSTAHSVLQTLPAFSTTPNPHSDSAFSATPAFRMHAPVSDFAASSFAQTLTPIQRLTRNMATLPLEIQREILEVLALGSDDCMRTLRLVSKRVKYWMDPFVHRLLVVQPSGTCGAFSDPPAHFSTSGTAPIPLSTLSHETLATYGKYVRHALIASQPQLVVCDILKHCRGIQNLALWIMNVTGRTMDMKEVFGWLDEVRRLSVDAGQIFAVDEGIAERQLGMEMELGGEGLGMEIPFGQRCFLSITHLDLINVSDPWCRYRQLEELTKLTHLSLTPACPPRLSRDFINQTLELPSIQVVIIQFTDERSRVHVSALVGDDNADPRLVTIRRSEWVVENWIAGVVGDKANMWVEAEGLVAAQKEKRKN